MKSISIEGELRKDVGTSASKALRKASQVPCVLYGGEKNVNFSANLKQFKKLVYTPEFYKVTIKVGSDQYEAIMKDIQFHPTTEDIVHIDFQELSGKAVITEIPTKLTGLAQGVKDGGRQIHKLRKLKVKVLPKDLMEHIELDVSELTLGTSIAVKDLDIPEYEFLNTPGAPIVTVEVQREMKEDREAAAEAEELAAEEAEALEGEEGEAPAEGEEGEAPDEGAEGAEEKKEEPAAE